MGCGRLNTKRTDNNKTDAPVPSRILSWIIGSAGVSGALVATGFIVDISYQSFLGYQLHHGRSASYYLTVGGEFFVAIISLITQLCLDTSQLFVELNQVVIWAAILVLIIVGVVAYKRPLPGKWYAEISRQFLRVRRMVVAHTGFTAFILLILIFFNIIVFDAPTLQISSLLTQGFNAAYTYDNNIFQATSSSQLWTNIVCMRFDETSYADLNRFGVECSSAIGYQSRLQYIFLLNFLASVLLACLGFSLINKKSSKNIFLVVTLIFVILIDLALLPYSYGKTLNQTNFNEVILHMYLDYDEDHYDEIEKHPDFTSDQYDKLFDKRRYTQQKRTKNEHGFLLSLDEQTVVFFSKSEKHIWIIPAGRARIFKVERRKDVLQFYLKKLLDDKKKSS